MGTSVTSDKLILNFAKAKNESDTNKLSIKLAREHGTEVSRVQANKMLFNFARSIADRKASNQLVISFNSDSNGTPVVTPVKKRKMQGVMAIFSSQITERVGIAKNNSNYGSTQHIAYDLNVVRQQSIIIRYCSSIKNNAFKHIANTQTVNVGYLNSISSCYAQSIVAFKHIAHSKFNRVTETVQYKNCNVSISTVSVNYQRRNEHSSVETIGFKRCLNPVYKGRSLAKDEVSNIQQTVPVPCRYFPIPEPPKPPPKRQCRLRPPSNQIVLNFYRPFSVYDSSKLHLNLTCWHDESTLPIAIKDTYMIYTELTATIGGISVEPLSFNIKTDMNSYCWSGDIDISPDDYERIKHKLDVAVGSEPILSVMVNNHRFSIIAEESGRSRSFASHTHNISGRSITARLGADYAKSNDKLFEQDNYASQIVNEQLNGLSVTVEEFGVKDWRIPSNTYSISNKTPISVIAEIADAAGGFVVSHDYDTKLSIKKRWKVNAWDLSTATPDMILPADVFKKIDDKPISKTRYNVVEVMGNTERHSVYRQTQGRDIPAPTQTSALFTDQNVSIPKASAILSESGKHNIYQLKLPWSDEITLAELGQIWQVNDLDGSWRGIVKAISISIDLVDDAPVPFQTVTVDRYLDV